MKSHTGKAKKKKNMVANQYSAIAGVESIAEDDAEEEVKSTSDVRRVSSMKV